MVANVRCEDIKNDQLAAFAADQAWTSLVDDAQAGLLRDFGARAAGLKDSCLDGCAAGGQGGGAERWCFGRAACGGSPGQSLRAVVTFLIANCLVATAHYLTPPLPPSPTPPGTTRRRCTSTPRCARPRGPTCWRG
jgi:hypothetical protein